MRDLDNEQVDRWFARISYLVIGFAMAFLGTLGYWAYEPDRIISAQGVGIILLDKEAKAGDFVRANLTYCKEVEEPVLFTRSFVAESTVISNPTLVETTGRGCVIDRLVTIPVPPQTGSGEYRIRYSLEAKINPLKTVHEEHWSSPVKVIGKEDQ